MERGAFACWVHNSTTVTFSEFTRGQPITHLLPALLHLYFVSSLFFLAGEGRDTQERSHRGPDVLPMGCLLP